MDAALRERQIIERQVAHLVALVDDLLDVSRITRGKVELRRTLIEAAAIVAWGIEMASPLLEQHHHELLVEVPREGPNAAKYTEPGGRIHVVAHGTADEVVLSVRDSGVGIDAAMLPTIFDLFVQEGQSLDRSQGGLGGERLVRRPPISGSRRGGVGTPGWDSPALPRWVISIPILGVVYTGLDGCLGSSRGGTRAPADHARVADGAGALRAVVPRPRGADSCRELGRQPPPRTAAARRSVPRKCGIGAGPSSPSHVRRARQRGEPSVPAPGGTDLVGRSRRRPAVAAKGGHLRCTVRVRVDEFREADPVDASGTNAVATARLRLLSRSPNLIAPSGS